MDVDLPSLKRRDGTSVPEPVIDLFRQDFNARHVRPGDAGYDAARRVWNAGIDKYPGLIVRCASVEDVVRAVRFASANDLLVAVRGGGHNVAGRAVCDGGIVIDLAAMKAVSVDPKRRVVHVQGGALLGDVDQATARHGLAVPCGVVSKTGMAGLTLGGGTGWLTRRFGLACDSLLSCEIVAATGDVLTADVDTNSDLFWGLRGGGGNFGIATSLLYQAHPVSQVLGGLIVYPRDQARPVLRHYRDFMASAPDALTAYAGLLSMPDGTPVVTLLCCYSGELAQGEQVLAPLRGFGSPVADMIQPMPFVEIQKLADQSNPDDMHNYMASRFLDALSDDAIDCTVDYAAQIDSPLSFVVLQVFGGAMARIDSAATAFAHRQTRYCIAVEAKWHDPAESEKHTVWARGLSKVLAPYASPGYLPNFLGDEPNDVVRETFGRNYARLVDVKTKYDPTNFFRLNNNIPPRS
jgi:FAD binding domain/Berberine and berberine like